MRNLQASTENTVITFGAYIGVLGIGNTPALYEKLKMVPLVEIGRIIRLKMKNNVTSFAP
jgi:hypothetical protein